MTADTAIARLRAANPAPVGTAAAADAAELFDRITLTRLDPRLGSRPRRSRRPLAVAIAAVAVLATSAFTFRGLLFGSVVGPSVTRVELRKAESMLQLPPGYSWPAYHFRNDTVMNLGAGGSIAVSFDQTAWECAWADALRRGDTAAAAKAESVLDDLMAHRILVAPKDASENWSPPASTPWPYLVYAGDGGYQYKQRLYAQAAAGNPAGVAQSCKVNSP